MKASVFHAVGATLATVYPLTDREDPAGDPPPG